MLVLYVICALLYVLVQQNSFYSQLPLLNNSSPVCRDANGSDLGRNLVSLVLEPFTKPGSRTEFNFNSEPAKRFGFRLWVLTLGPGFD